MSNPEHGGFIPPEESDQESIESVEIDREFILRGLSDEIQKAQDRERAGQVERWGRATFVAARSSEVGIPPELEGAVWEKMVSGLQYKRDNRDAWGISFQARYLKAIDSQKFSEITFSAEEEGLLTNELTMRRAQARTNPRQWTEYFAMLSHVKEIRPGIVERWDVDESMGEGLKECLDRLSETDPIQFVHAANAATECSAGVLQRIGVQRSQVERNIALAAEKAQEAKEKQDVWLYAFIGSQIKSLEKLLS